MPDHDTRPTVRDEEVVPADHLVDFADDVGGVHHFSAGRAGGVDHAHDGFEWFFNGAVGTIRLKLVILNEIDGAFDEFADEIGGGRGDRPTLGLTMLPMTGRSQTPQRRRVPAKRNCGRQ